MSKIIYMKDILLAQKTETSPKRRVGRPKLKPFEQKSIKNIKRNTRGVLRSSLVECDKKKSEEYRKI